MASKNTLRIRRIRDKVTLFSLYPKLTGKTIITSFDVPQQVRCPFHGKDNKPSARLYPDTDRFYCFVCKESMDAFSFFQAYVGMSFKEDRDAAEKLLSEIEEEYNLEQYSLDDYKKDDDQVVELDENDFRDTFVRFWFTLNDQICESDSLHKVRLYEALDLVWDKAMSDNNFKTMWEFLHKLGNKHRRDL